MPKFSLTASMRTNLLSLKKTQNLIDQTQLRLSTGKKVNSAIDNPLAYYTAQSLTNRAHDLESLLDNMGQGIQTLKAANEGIESLSAFVQQAKAVANTARDTPVTTELNSGATFSKFNGHVTIKIGDKEYTVEVAEDKQNSIASLIAAINNDVKTSAALKRAQITIAEKNGLMNVSAAENAPKVKFELVANDLSVSGTLNPSARNATLSQFNEVLAQMDKLVSDATYKGVNLLKGDHLKVVFNEDRSSYLDIKGKDASLAGLGLDSASREDWIDDAKLDGLIDNLDDALTSLRHMANEFGNNYAIVQSREEYTENMINVLEEGADDLTLADMNEESANMLALQTRLQLGINSLALASQAAQSVLRLFS